MIFQWGLFMFLNKESHLLNCCVAAFLSLALSASAETITVGGVGSLTPLVQLLLIEYSKKNPGIDVIVISPPMGSTASIRALASGKVDVSLSARTVGANESAQVRPWLKTPLVLATSDGDKRGVTRAQIAEIYAGRRTNWANDRPIRIVMRGENESETAVLRTFSPEVDTAIAIALKRTDLPFAENDLDAIDLLSRIHGSFGSTNIGLIKASGARLVALPIDGVEPTTTAVGEGRYPWLRKFYLLTTRNPTPAVADFVNWLQSPSAMAIGHKFDYLPLK